MLHSHHPGHFNPYPLCTCTCLSYGFSLTSISHEPASRDTGNRTYTLTIFREISKSQNTKSEHAWGQEQDPGVKSGVETSHYKPVCVPQTMCIGVKLRAAARAASGPSCLNSTLNSPSLSVSRAICYLQSGPPRFVTTYPCAALLPGTT